MDAAEAGAADGGAEITLDGDEAVGAGVDVKETEHIAAADELAREAGASLRADIRGGIARPVEGLLRGDRAPISGDGAGEAGDRINAR